MSWYIHPSKQLRDDELPPELVVTNRDGSIKQAYVPYDASDQLRAENAKLRKLVQSANGLLTGIFPYIDYSRCTAPEAIAEWRTEAVELGVVK